MTHRSLELEVRYTLLETNLRHLKDVWESRISGLRGFPQGIFRRSLAELDVIVVHPCQRKRWQFRAPSSDTGLEGGLR